MSNTFQYSYCGTDLYNNAECYYDLVVAEWFGTQPATFAGDSGAPEFVPVGPDQPQVVAKGTLTAEHFVSIVD